jgi:hypothetical protein
MLQLLTGGGASDLVSRDFICAEWALGALFFVTNHINQSH